MSAVLSADDQLTIFSMIRSYFNDLYYFDTVISSKLQLAIQDSCSTEIDVRATEKVAERYFDRKLFTSTEQKLVWAQIRVIFKACYILILSFQDYPRSLMLPDVASLLRCYPEFHDEGSQELDWLLRFRNMLRIALLVIPAENHKSCLIKIAARLEGSQKEYITGGGSKPAVQRREIIFERESGVTPVKRPEGRKRPVRSENGTKVKTSLSSFSVKKVRLVRLGSNDMRVLSTPVDVSSTKSMTVSNIAPIGTGVSSSSPDIDVFQFASCTGESVPLEYSYQLGRSDVSTFDNSRHPDSYQKSRNIVPLYRSTSMAEDYANFELNGQLTEFILNPQNYPPVPDSTIDMVHFDS